MSDLLSDCVCTVRSVMTHVRLTGAHPVFEEIGVVDAPTAFSCPYWGLR